MLVNFDGHNTRSSTIDTAKSLKGCHAISFNNYGLVVTNLLTRHVKGQLVGCGTVECPKTGCVVGNVTNLDLGIALFSSGISPRHDLTWTVGLADIPHDNAINDTWLKSYYLGTPPTLDLGTTSEISGCAVFFEDETACQFNVSAPETSIGTCQEALSAKCVSDLLGLATNTTTVLSSGVTSANESSVCSQLPALLKSNLPVSCQSKGLAGGAIVAKALTGPSSSLLPVQPSNCNLSTGGQAYKIALAESEFFRSDTPWESHVSAYIFGVTPVLTVFYPSPGSNSTLSLGQTEAHLTCLKIVEPGAEDSYPGLLTVNAAPSLGKSRAWVMVAASLGMAHFSV